eukprot:gene32569-42185_t
MQEIESPQSMHVNSTGIELPINSHYNFEYVSIDPNPVDENVVVTAEDPPVESKNEARVPSRFDRVVAFVITNFLPIGFLCALVFALGYPYPGKVVSTIQLYDVGVVQAVNSFNVFFISGVTLNISEAASALKRWPVLLLGILVILFVTPLLSLALVQLPMEPREFAVGLAIFCIVPTTLGVGVALTAASGGDQALALLLTLTTNCLGIVTVPLAIQYAAGSSVSFKYAEVFLKLCFTVLLPSLLGLALRSASSSAAALAKKHKTALSLFSTSNLVCLIWQSLSAAAATLLQQSAANIAVVAVAAALLHVLLLAAMYLLTAPAVGPRAGWMQLRATERVALIIMCAQKSAPVAVTVIALISRSPAQQGLLALPALVGQLSQIFLGSFLVTAFKAMIRTGRDDGCYALYCSGVVSDECPSMLLNPIGSDSDAVYGSIHVLRSTRSGPLLPTELWY